MKLLFLSLALLMGTTLASNAATKCMSRDQLIAMMPGVVPAIVGLTASKTSVFELWTYDNHWLAVMSHKKDNMSCLISTGDEYKITVPLCKIKDDCI